MDKQFELAKARVQRLFRNEIGTYVIPDLKRLTDEIRPDPRTGLRACTVPLALTLFSIIDLFGYLTRPDKDAKKRNTQRNFEYLLADSPWFPNTYKTHWKPIVMLFRHGLVHQFFPKAAAITKRGATGPVVRKNRQNDPELNVDVLSHDTLKALEELERALDSAGNEQLVMRINERLDKLAKEDYEDLANLPEAK